MAERILLVTTTVWSSAYRLAGAFAALGAHVEAVFPRGHVMRLSRHVAARHRYRALNGAASIAAAIRKSAPGLVIPCDDRALTLLLGLGEFAPLIERSLGPATGFAVLTARAPSMAAARQEGIAAPLTLAVDDLAGLPKALAEVGLPCVMKSDFSWGGEGIRFVTTEDEAVQAFLRLSGPPSRARSLARAVLRKDAHFFGAALHPAKSVVNLQAMVPGTPATSVFAASNGKVVAAHHMDVLSWRGVTGPASLMRRVEDPAMAAAVQKIAARFHLNGLHGLDFVRDAAGTPHLIEVNPRATQICHLPLDADLPAALLGSAARPAATALRDIALFPQLVTAPELPPQAYRDIPFDDPAVVRALSGEIWTEDEGIMEIDDLLSPERYRAVRYGPVYRKPF